MITIITPNLNNAEYIEENILSVQKLSIPFEHIIVDGGSTDESLKTISRYPHIKLVNQKEKTGMYGAIDEGIRISSGKYITWVNSDDRIIPENFSFMYNKIRDKDFDIIYSDGEYYFTSDKHTEFGKGRRLGKFFLKHGCMPAIQPSILFSKKIYNEVGGFRYDKFRICGDLDLFVRIAKLSKTTFKYIPQRTVIFLKRGNSLGDLNTNLYLEELRANSLPTPNFPIRVLFFICKYI